MYHCKFHCKWKNIFNLAVLLVKICRHYEYVYSYVNYNALYKTSIQIYAYMFFAQKFNVVYTQEYI